MRKLTALRPRRVLLNDFYVFDTETAIERNRKKFKYGLCKRPDAYVIGVVVGHNYERVIRTREEMVSEFTNPRYKNKVVFAHNAEYDLSVLYGNIFSLDPGAIFNGKFICATNGVCRFADSLNIFKTSVARIAKLLGMEKPDLDLEGWQTHVTPEAINRCVMDCRIVWDALFRTFEFAGDIKITQASLSLTYFRRHHLKYSIEHNENTAFFWESYYGGRTEVFQLGKTVARVIDANSMYPYTMKHTQFPNPKYLKLQTNVTNTQFRRILKNYEGCVSCTVIHKKRPIGFLPYRRDGKLLFPIGRFSGTWNFNELRFAMESGAVRITAIQRIVYSERMPSPFVSFVDFLYTERFRVKDDFEIERIKIFMNSLYGKFAQKIDEETIYIADIEKQFSLIQDYQRKGLFVKLQLFNKDRNDAFLITKSTKRIDISYSIPSFASYITSAARVHLLKKYLSMEANKIVYCDTDSLFYEIDTPDIVSESGLGNWKKEDKIITYIGGLKNYRYIKDGKEKEKIKGVPEKATKTGDKSYEYYNLLKTKESMRRNNKSGTVVKRTKKLTGKYDKRNVFSDGSTTPIEL
jgi:hypothetical protein